jgi:GTPase SAR1 family protein
MQDSHKVGTTKVSQLPGLSALEFPKHILQLPAWLATLKDLETLDLSWCTVLSDTLLVEPVMTLLGNVGTLDSVECIGCVGLHTPPREVCEQGGKVVAEFLRALSNEGRMSKRMSLFLIGDEGAGKTSIVSALRTGESRAHPTRNSRKSAGINISEWQSTLDCHFKVFELSGQAVYSKLHQAFLRRRAIYLFTWRAGFMERTALEHSVKFWLDTLQVRLPGAEFVMAVTHIDQVEATQLDLQCSQMKTFVSSWLAGVHASRNRLLSVWAEGESLRLNCLSGEGVDELRSIILQVASDSPFYREMLPASWIRLQERLSSAITPCLDWEAYSDIAESSGVQSDLLFPLTAFLHESGHIWYWGSLSESIRSAKSESTLKNTVYLSPVWIMTIMKGLFSHNRQAMMDYCITRQDKAMLLRVNILNVWGILHSDLLPFIWPTKFKSDEYRYFLRNKSRHAAKQWAQDLISNEVEMFRALELLKGFDLMVQIGSQYIIPGLFRPSTLSVKPSREIAQCPFWSELKYHALPSEAFEIVIVRIARRYPHNINCTSVSVTCFDVFDNIAQLHYYDHNAGKGGVSKTECCLLLRSSSKSMMECLKEEVRRMERKFPGLDRLSEEADTMEVWHPPLKWRDGIGWHPPLVHNVFVSSYTSAPDTFDIAPCAYCPPSSASVFRKSELRTHLDEVIACPACHNLHSVADLMTAFKLSEIRPCPCCQQRSEEIPGYFNAGHCRMLLKLLPSASTATLTCYICMARERTGQILVVDIARPEIYVSGLNLLAGRVHENLSVWLRDLQVEADIVCCQTIAKRIPKMETSLNDLDHAPFFACFLTDAYIHSPETRNELRIALQTGKRILPILVTETQSNNQIGITPRWGGPEGKDYWKHASALIKRRSSKSLQISTSTLSCKQLKSFPPFIAVDSDLDRLLASIAYDIKSHLQRPEKLAIYTDFSLLGVRLSYFDKFIRRFGKAPNPRASFEGLTTEAVMRKYVWSATKESQLSFCELLLREGEDSVGTAEVLYSHVWKYLFLDVVDSAKLRYSGTGKDPVVWFDVFSLPQHRAESKPLEWWSSAYLSGVGAIGKVLMMIQPFESEVTNAAGDVETLAAWAPLTRIGCVFELYACETTQSLFDVTMTEKMAERFVEAMVAGDTALTDALLNIDCEKCTSFRPADMEQVLQAMTRSIGFAGLNSMVLRVMERWIYSVLLARMKDDQTLQPQCLRAIKSLCEQGLDLRLRRLGLGQRHADVVQSRVVLACVLRAESSWVYLESLVARGGAALAWDSQVGFIQEAAEQLRREWEASERRRAGGAEEGGDADPTGGERGAKGGRVLGRGGRRSRCACRCAVA